MTIITAAILIYNDWLLGDGFAEYYFTGFVSLFWMIVLPLFLIGYLGNFIQEYIKTR